jgi:hypothetical protein
MPRAWTGKDERKYQHIRESALERGRTPDRAKEIAARTVNRDRRDEGRAKEKTSHATGNPNAGLEERSRHELYERAKQLHIAGRSRMTKAELTHAIRSQG